MKERELMTDKEIIQAFECCISREVTCCENRECPYFYATELYTECEELLRCDAFDLIKRQQAEIERLHKAIKVLDIMTDQQDYYVKKAKAEAIEEFWNNRPEQRNPEQQGKEEFNKGWNACLDSFFEVYEEMEKSNGSERSEAESQQGSETC